MPSRCTVGAGATSQLSLCSAGSNVNQWFCRHPPTLRHFIPATASLFMLRCVIGYDQAVSLSQLDYLNRHDLKQVKKKVNSRLPLHFATMSNQPLEIIEYV